MESKILIVDDVPKNIQMAMNILKNEGHKMYYAKSGEMALKLVNEHDFDLILLDIMMPDMNGFAVCSKLKSDEKTKNIPVIFLSGKDSTQDIEQAYESGGLDYVVKPFINIELITKANSYVKLKQLEDKFNRL
ncbi:MAG: response regulator [Arcobacter sp.]|jgi:putative two-component system response regulator|uniref:response regulator n=1 Tax=unclassified Arcobacter TaxID=2593671 RepID=UPI000229616B|nr:MULTISPECIES: response regulator [unclassified Arcobacter]MDY3199973.1 response regulator [Arcobacter sp.]BAK74003.1 truncated two-component response regulator [Arcobacter sp. L]